MAFPEEPAWRGKVHSGGWQTAAGGDAWSVIEVLCVALCYATGPLIASRKLNDLPPLEMTAVCLAFATIVYTPVAALTWPEPAVACTRTDPSGGTRVGAW